MGKPASRMPTAIAIRFFALDDKKDAPQQRNTVQIAAFA
jgi:hypothetical protein